MHADQCGFSAAISVHLRPQRVLHSLLHSLPQQLCDVQHLEAAAGAFGRAEEGALALLAGGDQHLGAHPPGCGPSPPWSRQGCWPAGGVGRRRRRICGPGSQRAW